VEVISKDKLVVEANVAVEANVEVMGVVGSYNSKE